jgi:GNAT superfamily N-acetyltransferase
MDIQVEPLKKCVVEMSAILLEYWKATEAHEGMPPLDMNWEYYTEQEAAQQFVLITARVGADKELIGFAMYIVIMHPHHKTVRFAICDILAVKLGYRDVGIGSKLVKAAEPLLKMYYVKQIVHQCRTVYDVEPLFPKLGFTLIEQSYMKAVK